MKQLIIVILLTINGSLIAQNFEDYYKEAAENNPQLKAVFNEYYAIRERTAQVQLPPPSFALGVFILPVETRLGAQRVRLGASQMFPAFGSLKAQKELISRQAALKLQEAEVIRNDLYFNLQNTWYQLTEINALVNIEAENIGLLEILERLAIQKIETGQGSIANVYQVKMKLNERKTKIELLQNEQPALYASIAQILNRDSLLNLSVPDTVPLRVLIYPKDSLKSWIREQNPNLQWIEFQKNIARQNIEVQKTKNRPTFGVGLDYTIQTKRTDADPPMNGQGILMPMFTINVPIYKAQNQARVKEVEFGLMALDDKEEYLYDLLEVQLEKAMTQYKETALKRRLYQEQIELTNQTLNLLITAYGVDSKGFDEVLKLEEMLFNYQRMLVQISIDQNKAVVSIEKLFAAPLN